MWYEINISKNGLHFFATDKRSVTNYEDLKEVYSVMKEKFTESEGYKISVTEWKETGKSVDLSL